MDAITSSADFLDSRDIIKRIEELEGYKKDLDEASDEEREDALLYFDDEDEEELEALKSLAGEADGSPDWLHGETLIRGTYFEEYARELAHDIGAVSGEQSWPNDHIDWEAAADELKQDYSIVEFYDVEYYIRA